MILYLLIDTLKRRYSPGGRITASQSSIRPSLKKKELLARTRTPQSVAIVKIMMAGMFEKNIINSFMRL